MIYGTAYGEWKIDAETASDLENNLMWCRSPLGQSGIGIGKIVHDSWLNMTKSYGRGVTVYKRSKNNTLGENVKLTAPHTTFSDGYSVGRESIMHAGYSNWRLPTLSEAITLTFDETWGARKVKQGESNCHTILKNLFHESCKGLSFCTANRCWERTITQELFELFSQKTEPVVWILNFNYEASIWDSSSKEYAALLVRNI